MKDQIPDRAIRMYITKLVTEPMTHITEIKDAFVLPGGLKIHKQRPSFDIGYSFGLLPDARFYRRWFEFEDLDRRGWAIIFRRCGPDEAIEPTEIFGGWVPPEKEEHADVWIARLNTEIQARFATPEPESPGASVEGELRWAAVFRETRYDRPGAPSIFEARGKRPPTHKAEVVAYLRKAKPITYSPGGHRDVFDPDRFVGGETLRTDGAYLWQEHLADYVDRYDVALPEHFERHMETREWKLPEGLDLKSLRLPPG